MRTLSLIVAFAALWSWSALLRADETERPTSEVIKDLKASGSAKQLEAAKILSTRKQAAVEDLIDMLKNGDSDLRAWAAYTLAQIGPNASQATPALTDMLKDKDPDLRAWAAYALGRIGPDAGKSLPELLSTCADPEPAVRGEALLAVLKIDPKLEMVGKLDAVTKKRVTRSLDANPDLTAMLFQTNSSMRPGKFPNPNLVSNAFKPRDVVWGHGTLLLGGGGRYRFDALPSFHGVFNKPDPVAPPPPLAIRPHANPLEDLVTLAKIDTEERTRELEKLLRKTSELSDRDLRGQLTAKDAQDRWAAVLVACDRGLHCETDLVERLVDKDDAVRLAARLALAVRSGGVDFGPLPDARKDDCEASAARWRAWLARRNDEPPAGDHPLSDLEKERIARKAHAAKKQEKVQENPDAGEQRAELDAARLVDEMRRANADQRGPALEKLRDGKGPAYTAGLAEVTARLEGNAKKEARQALAERLARMTAATLRAKLADDDLEIRRAAALACAMKDDIAFVPDVIPLMADSEPPVARAAYAALKSLSGKDFGPSRDATNEEKEKAIADWKAWWAQK